MKKFICLLASFFICLNLFCADGPLWGSKNKELKVYKTEWFDIIFPPESQESALKLYQNADRIYNEIAELYGHSPLYRMPVVLAPGVETFNAFFAIAPYNHIVLYDTIPSQSMLVNTDSLLGTFRHELTHAFTYNLKSPALQKADSFFGDVLVFSVFSITSGWAEGATLTSESSIEGEGRLNDEYSLHMARQAKIENQFPKYADVQGASDAYPYGSFYNFNGAFNQWLQRKFGMEKYAQFWYSCVNAKHLLAGSNFKDVYGIKINEAWKQFYDDFYVPDVAANPVLAGEAFDFFERESDDFSDRNNGGSLYSNLCKSDRGLYFIDEACNGVYFVAYDSDGDKIHPKKLFTQSGLNQISVSRDGRFIALQFTAQNSGTYREKIKLYDCQKKRFFECDGTAKTNPAVILREEGEKKDYFLVYTKFYSQKMTLCVEKLLLDEKNQISKLEEHFKEPLSDNVYNFGFSDLGNGSFAFIKSDALRFSICGATVDGEKLFDYGLPSSKMRMRGLSFADSMDGTLYFSWTDKGTLPRLGSFNLKTQQFRLYCSDISGGIFDPVLFNEKLCYVGKFYKQNWLLFLNEHLDDWVTWEVPPATYENEFLAQSMSPNAMQISASSEESLFPNAMDVPNAIPFKPFSYLQKGIFVPLSIAQSNSYTTDFLSYSHYLPFGITYITASPWTGGNFLTLTAGYGLETNSFASEIQYNGGTDTSLFNYSLSARAEFDFKGWKQAEGSGAFSVYLPFGQTSKIILYDSVLAFTGKNNLNSDLIDAFYYCVENNQDFFKYFKPGSFAPQVRDIHFYAYNDFGISWSNVHYSGSGKYERLGVSFTTAFTYILHQDLNQNQNANLVQPHNSGQNQILGKTFIQNGNLTVEANAYIPRLIPVTTKSGFVYNLPLKLSAALFPYDTISSKASAISKASNVKFSGSVLNFDAQTVLFAMDIQKALPLISGAFMNDFAVILRYNGAFAEELPFTWGFLSLPEHFKTILLGNAPYKSMMELKGLVSLTPNFGELARSQFRTDFFVSLYYSFVTQKFGGNFGISTSF